MIHRITRKGLAVLAVLAILAAPGVTAQDLLGQFEDKITAFTLDNGLTFIVIERHEAPVVSFHTYADVGSVDEVKGVTGLAHMFEHMAFKGTTTVGTKDIAAEMKALETEERIYHELQREKARPTPDAARIATLEAEFEEAKEAARAFIERGEFEKVIERAGATGLNATTNTDATRYFYSLPANKTELWFSLESDRFLHPVQRDFYTERGVVQEERRMRTESQPVGRLVEEFITLAFKAHPYGEPVIGHMADLQSFTRTEADDFFKTYYGANNLTIAIAGDVDPGAIRRMAETYFGRLPAGEEPPAIETVEPPQLGERRVVIEEQTQPFVLVGFHKGSMHHPDDAVYDVLEDVLGNGRTSRLYQNLVDEKVALDAGAFHGFPGEKYPNLFAFYAVPNQGRSPEEAEQIIYDVLEQMKNEGVSPEELARAKARARADLIRQLQSNTGTALQLARAEALTGDWRTFFRSLDALEAVTVDDIKRVAGEVFTKKNRTVAMIKTTSGDDTTAAVTE